MLQHCCTSELVLLLFEVLLAAIPDCLLGNKLLA